MFLSNNTNYMDLAHGVSREASSFVHKIGGHLNEQ
jgi:hypothetical protein